MYSCLMFKDLFFYVKIYSGLGCVDHIILHYEDPYIIRNLLNILVNNAGKLGKRSSPIKSIIFMDRFASNCRTGVIGLIGNFVYLGSHIKWSVGLRYHVLHNWIESLTGVVFLNGLGLLKCVLYMTCNQFY